MRLSDFIEATLSEIGLGVQRAKVRSKNLMAVAPNRVANQEVGGKTEVTFDVALALTNTTISESQAGGKAGFGVNISVVKAEIGTDGTVKSTDSDSKAHTHRVTFSVPVYLAAHFRQPGALAEEEQALQEIDTRQETQRGSK
ncbi:hypothetical protein [Sphingomonas sp. DC2300-3]|uniref:hypothetical protein n=1 Tax=unclassified Sphingomonas TaxID=196159 RepID=UPI003CF82F47